MAVFQIAYSQDESFTSDSKLTGGFRRYYLYCQLNVSVCSEENKEADLETEREGQVLLITCRCYMWQTLPACVQFVRFLSCL